MHKPQPSPEEPAESSFNNSQAADKEQDRKRDAEKALARKEAWNRAIDRAKARKVKTLTPTQRILEELDRGNQKAFGFKVYRLTYDDGAKWQMFMEKLDSESRQHLVAYPPEGITLAERLDWAIEDDKEKWDGTSFHDVRQHFKQLVDGEKPKYKATPRYIVCIAVDKECLDSAYPDDQLKDTKGRKICSKNWPFIKALDKDFTEENARLARLDAEQDYYEYLRNCQEDGEEIPEDQWVYKDDEPAQVGYLKVPIPLVIPRLYECLRMGFSEVYHLGPTPPNLWIT
ncbi:Twin arginine translocation protein [Neofusicoccum parvum]|uniref:Twin arginine translocation protein n=1 Tax=Neofusicoccum parvum TaxID=310453 RepID=A0ACB5S111_9PEZI|nr:Twin arginine translocation protein [Neofusicoccum parvum]GME42709.1 Twin arginine translocation protein [Neofusicoccum parvum]